MRSFTCLLSFMVMGVLYPQMAVVLDADSRSPIVGMAIFNEDNTKLAMSDFDGAFSLDQFNGDEALFFKHMGYETRRLSKEQIAKMGFKVFMVMRPHQLQEVVLSVSKWEQQKKNVPNKVLSLNARTIASGAPQTAADLLQQSGKVFVQKSQLGGGSPMIRGFATNRLVLSVDGVRMNNAIFRGGNIQNVISIDPFTIRNTEVIFGPGSVIYGSDAIGGVMNFYTKEPLFSRTDSVEVRGNAHYRFASANRENTLHASLNLGGKKWASLTSLTRNDFQDLRMGRHGPDAYLREVFAKRIGDGDFLVRNKRPRQQVGTAYDQLNLNQKVRYRPNSTWDAQLGLYYSETSDFGRYDRLVRPVASGFGLRSAAWYYGPQKWFMGNMQVNQKGNGRLYDRLRVTTAYQNFQESRNSRDFGSPWLYATQEAVDAYNVNLDLEHQSYGNLKLYYGAEYIHNKVKSEGRERNLETQVSVAAPSRYPDGATWQSLAAYVQGEYGARPNLSLLGGLRYNHIWSRAVFDTRFFNFPFTESRLGTGAFTGSLGTSWFPKKDLQLTANLSTGFRAPNIDDIGKVFDSEPGAVVVPNPNLRPEYAHNVEVGVRKNFGDAAVFSGAAYYTYLKDALVRRNFALNGNEVLLFGGEMSRVQAIQNAANAYVYGFEFGLELFFGRHWSFVTNLTLTTGVEEEENGEQTPARHAPPTFGDVHLVWKKNKWRANLFFNYNAEVAFNDLALSERAKDFIYATDTDGRPFSPACHTLNLRAQYALNDRIDVLFAWENLTDRRYRPYSSGLVAPGSNLVLGLNYAF
ncbi:TonB-dependent receptor domain-containing protein [Maribacter sp. 2307ULW6-5]